MTFCKLRNLSLLAFAIALVGGGLLKAFSPGDAEDDNLVTIKGLGALSFPNSGAPTAQEPFHRGVLLLHSFEFKQAAEAFRDAQSADPDFALAYWGEAMTYNHPLWRHFDWESGQAALERLAPTREARRLKAPTEREKRYLDAIETLYSFSASDPAIERKELCGVDGATLDSSDPFKRLRDLAYLAAMQELHAAYPQDDEARAFCGLAILGSKNGARDFATYMQAAATVAPVFERNPLHPGAAHYLIHSFDDPIHAPLGLDAANAYAEIAPNAAHAQHMTSHIFVAMGLWERTVTANLRAQATLNAELARRGEKPSVAGHYVAWLHYAYLQLGEAAKAEALMNLAHERVLGEPTGAEWDYFVSMRARHIVDTENWALAGRWAVPLESIPADKGGWGYGKPYLKYRITNALAGIHLDDPSDARDLLAELRPEAPGEALQLDQLAGLLALREGNTEEGLALLQKAAAAEDALPLEFGPPELVKPTFESLGNALLQNDRSREAAAAFTRATERTPQRTLAVAGLVQATNL